MARLCDEQGCERPHLARGLCKMHYNRRWYGREAKVCSVCGKTLRYAVNAVPICDHCYKAGARKSGLKKHRQAKRKQERAAAGTRGRALWRAGQCPRCGVHVTARLRKNDHRGYCSRACRSRDLADRRRARTRGVKITPGRRHAIFQRDNWTCQLCEFPVNRTAKVPDLEAPVIDHRVPLAAGGEHGPDNWQTAHFLCNSYKRDLLDVA